MRGIALVTPLVVLALMHLLQRLEVWALDHRGPTGRAVRVEVDARSSVGRRRVLRGGPDPKASDHG